MASTDATQAAVQACDLLKAEKISKKVLEGVMFHYTIQPLSTHAVQAGQDRGENMLGLQKVPQNWWVFTAEWPKDLSNGATVVEAHDELVRGVEKLAREQGQLLDYLCPSFARASQKVIGSFGEDNLKKMKEVAAKYDPEGVFQKLQNDGFLLRYA